MFFELFAFPVRRARARQKTPRTCGNSDLILQVRKIRAARLQNKIDKVQQIHKGRGVGA